MSNSDNLMKMLSVALTTVFLLMTTGCSSVNLGDIDDTVYHRNDMPGPGIFSDKRGESSLKWTTEKWSSSNNQTFPSVQKIDEVNEFELYKKWKKIRSAGKDSDEYQQFLLWLEFRKIKVVQ